MTKNAAFICLINCIIISGCGSNAGKGDQEGVFRWDFSKPGSIYKYEIEIVTENVIKSLNELDMDSDSLVGDTIFNIQKGELLVEVNDSGQADLSMRDISVRTVQTSRGTDTIHREAAQFNIGEIFPNGLMVSESDNRVLLFRLLVSTPLDSIVQSKTGRSPMDVRREPGHTGHPIKDSIVYTYTGTQEVYGKTVAVLEGSFDMVDTVYNIYQQSQVLFTVSARTMQYFDFENGFYVGSKVQLTYKGSELVYNTGETIHSTNTCTIRFLDYEESAPTK